MVHRLRQPGTARHAAVVVAAVVVAVVSLWQSMGDLRVSRFHPDESRWLNRSQHVRELTDPRGEYWSDKYLIRGQPPMGSYVMGIGLLLQGRDLDTNGPWNFSYGNEGTVVWNAARDNIPSEDDLIAARRTSVAIGMLTCLAVFAIVTMLTHWLGGLVAGLFMAVHPLEVYLSTLGVSDATFTGLAAFAVLAALLLARRPTWPRTLLLAVILAAGASTKLSPLFLSVGLAVIGLILVLAPVMSRRRRLGRFWERAGALEPRSRRLGWMLLSLPFLTAALFVLSYPYLWSDPIGRTQVLIEFRQREMRNQARIWEETSVDSRVEAIERTWDMLENRYSASGKLLAKASLLGREPENESGFDVPFAVAGMLVFAVVAFRRGFWRPHLLTFATLGGQALLILTGLRVDFDRYYLPMVMAGAVCLGIGVGQGWLWVQVAVARLGRRERRPAPMFSPSRLTGQRSAD